MKGDEARANEVQGGGIETRHDDINCRAPQAPKVGTIKAYHWIFITNFSCIFSFRQVQQPTLGEKLAIVEANNRGKAKPHQEPVSSFAARRDNGGRHRQNAGPYSRKVAKAL